MDTGKIKRVAGIILLCYSFIPMVTAAAIPLLPLPVAWRASFAGLYILSGELSFVISVMLLGKPFVQGIKDKLKRWFFPKRTPRSPKPVGKLRHYTGVVLFFASFAPYFASEARLLFGEVPDAGLRWVVAGLLAGDVMFVLSLLLLGSPFWRGLRNLFVWTPPTPQE
ncbi:MAG: transporter suffix domain-containing protein [Desulfovibrionaceae bacterium]